VPCIWLDASSSSTLSSGTRSTVGNLRLGGGEDTPCFLFFASLGLLSGGVVCLVPCTNMQSASERSHLPSTEAAHEKRYQRH
jgi:hypothetical protein